MYEQVSREYQDRSNIFLQIYSDNFSLAEIMILLGWFAHKKEMHAFSKETYSPSKSSSENDCI